MFFWHRRISIIIVSSSRHLQRSVSPAEILHPLEASDTHSQAPPGWLTGRRDQARMLTNVVSPIIHLYWGWCINYLSIYLSIYLYLGLPHYIQTHTNTYQHVQNLSDGVFLGGRNPRWHQEFNKNPHLKHINSSKRTFRHSRCNPSTKNHRGQSTHS